MTKSPRKNVPDVGIELGAACMPSEHASDRATAPGEILGQLKWKSLKKRRKAKRLILLYKGLKGKASVPTDDLIPKTRRARNQHSIAFQTPIANTDVYKGSFFPQTIRYWNAIPDSLISSAKMQRIMLLSKKISNDQELIQSDPTSCPQKQKGNN